MEKPPLSELGDTQLYYAIDIALTAPSQRMAVMHLIKRLFQTYKA